MAEFPKAININLNLSELEFAGAAMTVGRRFQHDRLNFQSIFEYDKQTGNIIIKREGIIDCIALINPTLKHNRDAFVYVVEELPRETRLRMAKEKEV